MTFAVTHQLLNAFSVFDSAVDAKNVNEGVLKVLRVSYDEADAVLADAPTR